MDESLVRRVAIPDGRRRVTDGELGLGLAVTAGAVLASALIAARYTPSPNNRRIRRDFERLEKPPFNPPAGAFAIWFPLYGALTVSGWRIWNARPSPDRSRALVHWFGIQGLNALWMYLGFGRQQRGIVTAEAALTLANAAAYVDTARRVDPPAAWLAVPYTGWIGFAALLTEELWRRNR